MKKFIFKLFGFLALFFLFIAIPIEIISSYDNIDKTTSNDHNIVSLQTKSKYDDLDILFIGNSYCYSSINTEILDSNAIKSFNLGIATAGNKFYSLLVDDYLNNTKKYPRCIFVLISPMTFSTKADNFISYPIHRYLEKEKSTIEIIYKFNLWNQLIPMYKKSLEKGFKNIIKRLNKNIIVTPRSNKKGFSPSNSLVNDSIIKNTESLYLSLKTENFPNNAISLLLDFLQKIEKKGVKIIFFEVPTYQLQNYFEKSYITDYYNAVKILSKYHTYIKINPNLFCKENFRNIDHMNSSGARISTIELINQIKSSGIQVSSE